MGEDWHKIFYVDEICNTYWDDFMPNTLIKGFYPDWINWRDILKSVSIACVRIGIKSSLYVDDICDTYRDDFMPNTSIKGFHPDWIN